MTTTLYIGNLTWDCTDDDLFTLFVESGLSPQTAVVVFGDEGRSRGYGLATFKDDAAGASNAIETLNGLEFQGRTLAVRADRGSAPREPRQPRERRQGGGEGKGGEAINELALFCGNLAWETTTEAVQQAFAQWYPVGVDLKIGRDGRSRGFAIVTFADAASAAAANVAMAGFAIDGRDVNCRFDKGKGGGASQSRGAGGGGGGDFDDANCTNCSVFVGNLSWDTTSETLNDIFAKFNCVSTNVVYDRHGERSRGYGTAMFSSPSDATAAIAAVDGMDLDGREIFCKVDRKA